jgi:hypothetical protein
MNGSMNEPSYNYFFYGYHLRSAIPLSSLPAWPVPAPEAEPEITLNLGKTPSSLDDLLWSSPFIQIARDKSALVRVAAVASFYLPNGREIIVQPAPGVHPSEIEAIFLSTVAGVVLHQRNLLPFHASCVLLNGRAGGRAIAITGLAAQGKSALAVALVQRGATLLADDLCVVNSANKSMHAIGGCHHARLWPDVMDHLKIPNEQRLATRPHHGKHAVALASSKLGSYPLTHLIRFGTTSNTTPELVPLHGPGSVLPARNLIFQRDIGHLLGNASLEFRTLTALAHHVRVRSLSRTQLLKHLDQCADLILAAIEGGA